VTQLLSGFGRPVFKKLGTGVPQFRFAEPVGIKINNNSSEVVSYKMVDGYKRAAGAKQIQNENTAAISIEAGSWQALELALGLESATTASLDLYELRFKEVPTSGPFEITDPDIGAALGVQATIVESGVWGKSGPLSLLATGAPATGQFRVDGANNKVIFNAAQAGATIAYPLIKNYTALRTIGKEAAASQLNSMGFEGLIYSEDQTQMYKLVIPKMIRTKSTSLDLGEKTTLEIEYRMVVAPGQANDYYLVELPPNYNPG
jgi:hypothetical protein